MTGFGSFLSHRKGRGDRSEALETGSLGRLLPDLLLSQELWAATPAEPLLLDFWLPDLQVMGARSFARSSKGLYIAAKGGKAAISGWVRETEVRAVDLARKCEDLGAAGIRVEKPSEIRGAIRQALGMGRPVVVDVVTEPESHPGM
jgi:hypothetical protein